MNFKTDKFIISLLIFTIVFSTILYFKLSHIIAFVVFSLGLAIIFLCLLNSNFKISFKNTIEKLKKLLGFHLARLVLVLIFILAVIPTKIFEVIFKRDRLKLKGKKESYWQNCDFKNDWHLQY